MPDIPKPTAADLARDAAADYTGPFANTLPITTAWIRRAVAAERSLAESVRAVGHAVFRSHSHAPTSCAGCADIERVLNSK